MVKLKTKVNEFECLSCGGCASICPKNALSMSSGRAFVLDNKCICCGICVKICPVGAINEVD